MSRIRLLSEATVNRIAAGEVIERPAAAAKELVENALDAGATRIAVSLDGGGIDRLEVADNGCGMTADELSLCVLRHATSKLADESLVRITTLGFRGEALPSIGAAARLRITSRPSGAEHANSLTVEGGAVSPVAPAAAPAGTQVVVRDLFFATPARRKFLKNPRTEASHVEAVVRRLALSAPHAAFRLEIEGRPVFEVPAQDRAERVAALLGPETKAGLLPVEEERHGIRLSGYACAPSEHRITPAGQVLIVNRRPVADSVLRTAVKVAYRDVIAPGRHAVVALYLDLAPEDLDVNVHPAKTELRFRDADAVRGVVIGALRRALGVGTGTVVPMVAAPTSWASAPWQRAPARPADIPPPLALTSLAPAPSRPSFAGVAEAQLPLHGAPAARQVDAVGPLVGEAPADYPLGAPVAQVLDTYIIAVAADGSLVLVDQHAAHERLTHEAIKAQMLDGGVRSQPLLLPAVIDLPHADVARLTTRAADLAQLGLELEPFGPGAVLVRATPAALGAPEPGPLLRDLADELAELGEQTVLSARLDAIIARLACHGSIRAGRRLSAAEMGALLRRMEATPRAATCSHGRPTVLKLSKADLERMFGRR
ncbi:MAG TPA: DNA mismatch repair endonuclease MutL [Rhodopila sp.]|nr:DNA mismatch repair endonuclease MutL [Rhodopila sp.]